MDSVPVVAITGQVATHLIGTDAFQEADITGITAPITKHNYLIQDIKDLPVVIKEAFHIASTGRPGPVLIDIPVDVSKGMIEDNIKVELKLEGYKPTYTRNPRQILSSARGKYESKKPVIFAGGGIVSSGAGDILTEFAHVLNIPVITTLLGTVSYTHL